MIKASWLPWVFMANATVLITHQIDAAFWHEWELFHIPGGNQVNLILNIPIIALVLLALREVVTAGRCLRQAHQLLAFLGFLTLGLHSAFFVLGHEQFIQPVSIALLVVTGVLSVLQLACLRVHGSSAVKRETL